MYAAEVNTQPWRNRGAGLATATNWICNYAVVLVTPIGIANIAWRYYIIYATLNFLFVPIICIWYVETAGLSLEGIDSLFEGRKSDADSAVKKIDCDPAQLKAPGDEGQSEWVEMATQD
jgi:hypothetical protein